MEGQRMEIGYMLLDPKLNFIEERAICKVRIPSEALPGYLDPVVADPTAVLLLKTTDDIHCIKMMRESQHPNIMHALVVGQKGNYITVWAESHTGPVASCLDKIVFRTSNIRLMSGGKILLPTTMLQSLVSQIFDGLEYLKLQGKYHGNFSLENTYYQQSGDEIVVKLTGFKLKVSDSKFNQQHQAVDCQDVGKALKSISEVAGQYSKGRQCFDCYQINDLAEKLKEVSWGDIPYIYQEIRGHPFFWDFETTKLFFVSQIPLAMNSSTFRSKVNGNEEICPHLPWSYDGYDGLLNLMDRFRQRKNIPDYDKNSRVGYVQFLSGLYAHEKELQAKVSVDTAVRQRNPRIFLILYNMVPKPLRFSTSN